MDLGLEEQFWPYAAAAAEKERGKKKGRMNCKKTSVSTCVFQCVEPRVAADALAGGPQVRRQWSCGTILVS
jgi:hypothetical protein